MVVTRPDGVHTEDVVERTEVERARAGDPAAFDALARAAADRLMSIAYRILREVPAAEDAVQSTLLQAWRELPDLRWRVRPEDRLLADLVAQPRVRRAYFNYS